MTVKAGNMVEGWIVLGIADIQELNPRKIRKNRYWHLVCPKCVRTRIARTDHIQANRVLECICQRLTRHNKETRTPKQSPITDWQPRRDAQYVGEIR